MENTTLQVLPTEVNDLALKVPEDKREEVKTVLFQIFKGTDEWESQVDSIDVKGVDDTMSIELAETARKNSKTARLAGEKLFDGKRDDLKIKMADDKLEDSLWLKSKQIMQLKFKHIEDKAAYKANFVKRYNEEQKELKSQLRFEKVLKFNPEAQRIEIEDLSDDMFEMVLSGLEKKHNEAIEAENKAEAERIEAEKIESERIKAEAAEKKRIQADNERLRKEAEAKEKQADADRLERERLAKIEADKQAKKDADLKVKQEAERKAYEAELKRIADAKEKEIKERQERNTKRDAELKPYVSFIRCYANLLDSSEEGYQKEFKEVKLAANLQWADDKKESDSKAEKERIQEEKNEAARVAHNKEVKRLADELKDKEDAEQAETKRLAQIEADKIKASKKAALAPEKDKITLWIDSMKLNDIDSKEFSMSGQATVNIIKQKFESFKQWAIEQKETIK